jgi:hypothetical protein
VRRRRTFGALVVVTTLGLAGLGTARAGVVFPPWSESSGIPLPRWAKSVAPHTADTPVFRLPSRGEDRRGTLPLDARPPLYGSVNGQGCGGRWLQVGPMAWVCSDDAELSGDDPPDWRTTFASLPPRFQDDGLGFRYAFVGPEGASGFRDLAHADEDAPEADLDPGFAVTVVEEADAHGERWGKTRHGVWIALRQLYFVPPLTLHGDVIPDGKAIDVGWVLADRVASFGDAKGSKAVGARLRFDLVHVHESVGTGAAAMVRVSEDGAAAEWIRAKDVARPTTAPPPEEVGGAAATERWIDVDLATETLVAYQGTRPVYVALVSTGRGAPGTETGTPRGVFRIWVKLETSTMGNLGDEDAESRYSIEDVPYVQFFAKGVALHGAFWHHSFGFAHSHGCVNLAPVDARWLFAFTAPEMPPGWSAVLPAGATDPGTVVRVR